ncbi:MAG: FAD binding domain-containing protein [Actinomycetota bacterium]
MSLTNIETFVHPRTVEEAFAALGDHATPISGGTDVMLRNPKSSTTLVDLMALPLADITESATGFSIGANATLTAMAEHQGLAAHLGGVLPEMLVHVGSPLLRNVATLGGHLARGRLSDVVPVLVALDADILWYDGGHRSGPIARFYESGAHATRMLITGVTIPTATGNSAGAFHKFLRTFFDIALLNAACVLRVDGAGAIDSARVVVGETPSLGMRVDEAEAALIGGPPDPGAFAAAGRIARDLVVTRSDSRASAEYRSQLAGVAVERCLAKAASRLEVAS